MTPLTIFFIVCHAGPADHFAVFADSLAQKGHSVQIFASGPALAKLQHRQDVRAFAADEAEAEKLADVCRRASAVITDVGHLFDLSLQEKLAERAPNALRAAYYDNPEAFVPGGYSDLAEKVMLAAQRVFYANANLANRENSFGIGYYPLEAAKAIAKKRAEREAQEKTLVYAGGNNEVYFSKAFPAFLNYLSEALKQGADFSDSILYLQQHPGAKAENRDAKMFLDWVADHQNQPGCPKCQVSKMSMEDAQTRADCMFYYQTSMAPQFALSGIPTIQVGHEPYADILVRNNLAPSASSAKELLEALARLKGNAHPETVVNGLGIKADWAIRFEKALIKRA